MIASLRAYQDKAVAIYGMGPSGIALAAALIKAGADVYLWDESGRIRARLSDAGFVFTAPDDWPWDELQLFVPGAPERGSFRPSHAVLAAATRHEVDVCSDVELFARAIEEMPQAARPFVIGVTGTHGKSVTASLIAHVLASTGLSVHCAGDAGKPLFSLPEPEAGSVYVIELPVRTLAFTSSLRCHVGVMLNMLVADKRFFRAPDRQVRTFMRAFHNQQPGDAMIIGADDMVGQKVCTALTSNVSQSTFVSEHIVPVSGEAALGLGIFSLQGQVYDARSTKTSSLADIRKISTIAGTHFHLNAAAAIAACLHFGLTSPLIEKALTRWPGMPGRMHLAGEVGNISFWNDVRASGVKSAIAAATAAREVYWIGGGLNKITNYRKLREAEFSITRAFLYGEAAPAIQKATSPYFKSEVYASPEEAVLAAVEAAQARVELVPAARPTVLLSPGCPGPSQHLVGQFFNETVDRIVQEKAA